MYIRSLFSMFLLVLCSCDDAEEARTAAPETSATAIGNETAEDETAEDETAEDETAEDETVENETVEPAAEELADSAGAIAFYRSIQSAYSEGRADDYFSAYASPLRCFFGAEDATRETLESARGESVTSNAAAAAAAENNEATPSQLNSLAVEVISTAVNEVTLADFGWTGKGVHDPELVFHQKLIILQRSDDAWQIVAETNLEQPQCGLEVEAPDAPEAWTRLNQWWQGFLAQCEGPEGADTEDFPGIGGSNGCDPSYAFDVALCADADSCGEFAEAGAGLGVASGHLESE